ncbi:MAG: hypothetical protein MJE66_21780 [Proteobacteria bacterium]|nr:hypothetical protein [Pseudomonadota bacterium]
MFYPRSEPVLFSELGVHGLRMSLNTPVINVDELPVGPAKAAIVLYSEEYGALRLAIGVRSLRAAHTAVYVYQHEILESSDAASAVKAGLAYAEAMGFLFEEESVQSSDTASRTRAFGRWQELMDQEPQEDGATTSDRTEELVLEELAEGAEPALDEEDEELSLDEAWEAPPELADEVLIEEDEPEPAPVAAATGSHSLSKFRSNRERDGKRGALGRVRLVKKRVDGAEGDTPNPLLRLLSSF